MVKAGRIPVPIRQNFKDDVSESSRGGTMYKSKEVDVSDTHRPLRNANYSVHTT